MARARWLRRWLVAALAAGCGCAGDAAAPGPLATMEIRAGNHQGGPEYGPAPIPLRVGLQRADGSPFPGGEVSWHVPASNGTVTPPVSISDLSGEATTTLTLGLAGLVRVEARAAPLNVILVFEVLSIPRCNYVGPFRLDTTVTGELASPDCQFGDGTYVDFYRLDANGVQAVGLTMQAAFDAFVVLYDFASGAILALDDNGGTGTHASLKALVPSGTYVPAANSAAPAMGAYTLAGDARPRAVSGCEIVWLVGPLTLSDVLAADDCPGPYYADLLLVVMYAGQTISVGVTSGAINPHLELYRGWSGVSVAERGDGGSSARIDYRADTSGVYVLEVSSTGPGQTGAYALTVSDFTPAPLVRPHETWRRPLVALPGALRSSRRRAGS